MPESKMLPDLSAALNLYLVELRHQPLFRELILALPRSRLRPWQPKRKDEQDGTFKYESGVLAGERKFVQYLLGDDYDRRTELDR